MAYYSVIPATIMHDPNLSANEKLLYAEITALANNKGYCYALNKALTERLGCSERSIQRWLQNLINKKYLTVKVIRDANNVVVERRIYINDAPSEQETPSRQECREVPTEVSPPSRQNCRVENTYENTLKKENTTYSPKKAEQKPKQPKFQPPTVEEIREYCKQRKNNVDAQRVYDFYSASDWIDSRGKPVRNWKQKIIGVWEKQENFANTKKLPDFEYKPVAVKPPEIDEEFRRMLDEL